jgi:hypothetical protein
LWTGTSINSLLIPAPLWANGSAQRLGDPSLEVACRDALELEARRIKAARQSGALARAESLRYFTVCERIQGLAASLIGQPGVVVIGWHEEPQCRAAESATALLRLLSELGNEAVFRQMKKILGPSRRPLYPRFRAVFHSPDFARDHWLALDRIVREPAAQPIRDRLINADAWGAAPRRLELLERAEVQRAGLVDLVGS